MMLADLPLDTPRPESPKPNRLRSFFSAPWLVVLFLVVFAALLFRFPQESLSPAATDSWQSALLYAHAAHLQFGTDLVSTYGPLGYLVVGKFSLVSLWPHLVFELGLTILVVIGVFHTLCRCGGIARFCLVLSLVAIAAWLPTTEDFFLGLALVLWGLICWGKKGDHPKNALTWLIILCIVSSVIRFNYFISSIITLGLLAVRCLAVGDFKRAAGIPTFFLLGILGGWLLWGQKLPHLIPYFKTSFLIWSSGNDLRGGHPVVGGAAGLLLLGLFVFWLYSRRREDSEEQQWIFFGWSAAMLFLVWRHGSFGIENQPGWSSFLLLAWLVLFAIAALTAPQRWLGDVLVFDLTGLVVIWCCWMSPPHPEQALAANFKFKWDLLRHPRDYFQLASTAFSDAARRNSLPHTQKIVGTNAVDIFGQSQAYALFNNFKVSSRPVMISLASGDLARMNAAFYEHSAPEFVLLDLDAGGLGFGPAQDSLAFRRLLYQYRYLDAEKPFLILKRKLAAFTQPHLISENDAGFDQSISLKEFGATNLWLELCPQATLYGKIHDYLIKPAPFKLKLTTSIYLTNDLQFGLSASTFETGLILNPVLTNSPSVKEYFQGRRDGVHPIRFELSVDADDRAFWQPTYHYRIYALENPIGRSAP